MRPSLLPALALAVVPLALIAAAPAAQVVERRDRPGARWHRVDTVVVEGDGRFKVRITKARGSRESCFRVRAEAVGDYEATTAKGPCIFTV